MIFEYSSKAINHLERGYERWEDCNNEIISAIFCGYSSNIQGLTDIYDNARSL